MLLYYYCCIFLKIFFHTEITDLLVLHEFYINSFIIFKIWLHARYLKCVLSTFLFVAIQNAHIQNFFLIETGSHNVDLSGLSLLDIFLSLLSNARIKSENYGFLSQIQQNVKRIGFTLIPCLDFVFMSYLYFYLLLLSIFIFVCSLYILSE